MEYLKRLEGEPGEEMFQCSDMSVSRLKGGAEIGRLVKHVINNYDLTDPAASIPGLLQVYQQIEALPDGFWKKKKLEETALLIRWCMGLYLEAAATHSAASPGEKITIRIEAVNRSDAKARLESIRSDEHKSELQPQMS